MKTNFKASGIYIYYSIAIILVISSCSKDDNSGIIFSKVTIGDYASRLEVPKMQSNGTLFLHHSVKIDKDSVMTYCMEYNPTKNHSRWVAFRFDGKTRSLGSGRSDTWTDDPDLPSKYKVGAGYYKGNGVRGHLCASYDRQYNLEANQQTFYMTNMSPMQSDFNSYYWTVFENYVREKASGSFADTLYVVKGGTIENGMTNGTVTSSGGKNIVIPKYYFIALLRFKAGVYSAIGFWIEHKDYGYYGQYAPTSVLNQKAVNIDYLEEKTGIDFFYNLPNDKENSVEAADITTLKSVWGL